MSYIMQGVPKIIRQGLIFQEPRHIVQNSFSSSKNWDPCANLEFRTSFVQSKGADMFTKQNGISEIGDCNELVAKNNQLQKNW